MFNYRKKNIFYLWSVFCVLCSAFIFSACASTEDVGRLQWDINELKADVKETKQKSQTFERMRPGLEEQLNKRLSGLENEQKATSNAVSDLLIKVQSLTTDVHILTGRFEEARDFAEKSSKTLTGDKNSLNTRVKELEITVNALKEKLAQSEGMLTPAEKQKPVESGKKTEETKPEETEKEKKLPEKDVKDLYMEAYQAYKDDDFEDAREKFQTILKDYPENEYSDNSRFWIAESYYKEKNYEEAILAYEELLKKNTKSDKVPGAMLKQGLAFYELNDKKTGKIVLEKLIEKFPDSEEAKIAKQKLASASPPARKQTAPAKKKQ